jgi:predicted ATP-grasp superfamily ATP-dependent carboligase
MGIQPFCLAVEGQTMINMLLAQFRKSGVFVSFSKQFPGLKRPARHRHSGFNPISGDHLRGATTLKD